MLSIIAAAALLLAFQGPDSTPRQAKAYDHYRQAAIHINDLAGSVRSEADARLFVDTVAEEFTDDSHLSWITLGIRHRIARAEYEAVSGPSKLIPEERIVNVWNEYVRELDAPGETLVTVAEMHNLRDGMYTTALVLWQKDLLRSMWTVPNIYALDSDGKVFNGVRPLEALKILHQMFYQFENVRLARERVQKGISASDSLRVHGGSSSSHAKAVGRLQVNASSNSSNPVQAALYQYIHNHGQESYEVLMKRLFEELIPKD